MLDCVCVCKVCMLARALSLALSCSKPSWRWACVLYQRVRGEELLACGFYQTGRTLLRYCQ